MEIDGVVGSPPWARWWCRSGWHRCRRLLRRGSRARRDQSRDPIPDRVREPGRPAATDLGRGSPR